MKQYETKEECLKENGEHAWRKVESDHAGMACAVYHLDGYCAWNDPVEKCYHCPAKRSYTRTQAPIFELLRGSLTPIERNERRKNSIL